MSLVFVKYAQVNFKSAQLKKSLFSASDVTADFYECQTVCD